MPILHNTGRRGQPYKRRPAISTVPAETASRASENLHWVGCIAGTLLVFFFVAFAVGMGLPPLNVGSVALVVMIGGFLLAWRHDWLGGVLSLLGIGSFYVWNFTAAGNLPSGWVFPLCFIPGTLQLGAWLFRRS